MEQPEAIARTLGYGGRFHHDGRVKLGGLDNNSEAMTSIKNLMIAGCGTSYFAGLYGTVALRIACCSPISLLRYSFDRNARQRCFSLLASFTAS